MAVDLKELKQRGVSAGNYKKLFTAEKKEPRIQKLVDTIAQRLRSGTEANLNDYRTYWAIDLAHETPFAQTTPTLIQNLLSKHLTADETLEQLNAWGLSEKELFIDVETDKGTAKMLNPPVFYQILIPIVRAYHTAKLAKIYNERDTSPLFKYRPAKNTDENRVKCEIVTDICDTTSQWYGYPEYLKAAIGQMIKYGICIAFPMEEWHYEEQVIQGRVRVEKEGLRYNLPHPTRMGYDLNHPAPTINTDTGCEFAYHWDLKRAGDILDNRKYWNRNRISIGTNWLAQPLHRHYFNEVYPCRMKFPVPGDASMKREDKAAYYGLAERDAAIFLAEFFWKLKPSDWGLGDYKYPVWHRFTVASDDTIIWAAPCAYNPMWFMGYDFDAQAGTPSSFSLETIPWQDHLGNILSQMILTGKQNLENVIFYDKLLVKKSDIDAIRFLGNKRYLSRQYLGYDSEKVRRAGLDPERAFFSPQFQYRSIVELQTMVSTALNIMERTLGVTAQEAGAAAAHYQGKEEILAVKSSGDNRQRFTASSVDSGIDAWKEQIYAGNMAYRDSDVTAHVSDHTPGLDQLLGSLGFKVTGSGPHKKLVAGKKGALAYVSFSRKNVDPTQNADPQMAQALMQGLTIIASNQEFTAKVGVPRILKMLEMIVKLSGGPADIDLTSEAQGQEAGPAFMAQLKPILDQLQQAIMGGVTESFAKPAAKSAAEQEAKIATLEQTVKQMEGIFALAKNASDKANAKAMEAQHKIQIDAATAAAEQQRLTQAHQAEQARLEAEHQAELRRASEKAQVEQSAAAAKASTDIQLQSAKTSADLQLKGKETEAAIARKNSEAKASSAAKKKAAKKPA